MTSETTYVELSFKNEAKPSCAKSRPPAVFFQKYSQLLKERKTTKELTHTALECLRENVTMEGKDWSCCPKNWKPFSSNCYFISDTTRNWMESEKNCLAMRSHLLVINTKDEQDFITQNTVASSAYYIGLSNPKGEDWQWVDRTPYNESGTFWHSGEPSNFDEDCVALLFRTPLRKWGWNDVSCNEHHRSLCKMTKIYL
uniref:C-type lectin domain family 4 member A n=1 Tax=Suricata suricatta TaxID=37032 RepID=A0A673TSM1_SURSU